MDHPASTPSTTSSSSSSWHKELERSLSTGGGGEPPLYSPDAQHFSPGLPSLLQRPQSGERAAWVAQWPQMWSMAAPQHRSHAQVWGDPTFRPFFPDPSQDLSQSSSATAGFRSPWEPPHDVKTIETVLSSVVEQQQQQQQPLNYRTDLPPFRPQPENLTAASSSSPATSSPGHSQAEPDTALTTEQFYQQNTAEAATFHQGYPAGNSHYENSPSEPANLTLKTAEKSQGEENRPELSPDLPKDLSCDRHAEEYPRDYSASYERRENSRVEEGEREEQEESYNIIKNMTEKYGESAVKQPEEVPSQREQG